MLEDETRRRMMLGAFEDALEHEGFAPPGFEILQELDRGGMAVVYLARQLKPEREVALKVVLPKYAGDAEIRERFKREARAMATLEHVGVLPVYQVGEWDGMAFLAMKLARGGTLQARLRQGLPEVREAVGWMIDASEAVHFAHQRGVLHRDLKPGNLLFDEAGAIYVGDFGVAKMEFAGDGGLTRTEALVGTPHYLAPEVAGGASNAGSVAAEIYGLGAILYECLTGQRPHDGAENLAAQLRRIVEDEIVPVRKIRPDVDRDLEVICMKALAKNPAERYGSVAEFGEDLRRWRDGREILARPASALEKAWRWARQHPLPAGLAALLFMSAVAGGMLLAENYKRRGDLLHATLLEQARAERLVREPGFRVRASGLLREARGLRDSPRIREEAAAVFASWEVDEGGRKNTGKPTACPWAVEVIEGGVRVSGKNFADWILPGGVLRCEPACSPDGRFLAVVRGERMEVAVYDVSRRKEFSNIPLGEWPERLVFEETGEHLRVVFDNGKALLAGVRGETLLGGFEKDAVLRGPQSFKVWEGYHLSPLEAKATGACLSGDHAILVTMSPIGLQLWDVENRRALEFHEVENQRIDAPTQAWWLGERRLLLQVPGSLETLDLDANGRVIEVREIERVPGTKVIEVRPTGDWLVEVRDEDGDLAQEIWPNGDMEKRQPMMADDGFSHQMLSLGGKIQAGGWTLTLPLGWEAQEVFYLEKQQRVIVLTRDYRVCEWDLRALEKEMRESGL
ncbi:MAG: protein kinase domain-containing protein [Luteolibacter sp.]